MASNHSSLNGKVIIVTGANTGIGYETALELACRGAQVILACRDLTRGQTALDRIKLDSKNDQVYLEQLNLGDFDSVRNFAKIFKEKWHRLDVLVNNAGITSTTYEKNKNGIEMIFAVNHLGPFLLTNLLLDTLKQSAPSRIVNVSSMAYKTGSIHWDDINLEKDFTAFKAYCQSKLGNVLFTLELTKRLEGTNVTAVSLHPGAVKTEIFRNTGGISYAIVKGFVSVFAKSPKRGAETSIYCATHPGVVNHPGAYYDDSKVSKLSKSLIESTDTARLWDLSEKLTK